MSISSWIEISLHSKHQRYDTVIAIISSFKRAGWQYRDITCQIQYLPLDDDGMFDWQSENLEDTTFFEIIRKKCTKDEIIGIVVFCLSDNVGMNILFFQNGTISLSLSINRKKTKGQHTDVNWYINEITHVFSFIPDIKIESIRFEESY